MPLAFADPGAADPAACDEWFGAGFAACSVGLQSIFQVVQAIDSPVPLPFEVERGGVVVPEFRTQAGAVFDRGLRLLGAGCRELVGKRQNLVGVV